jgi:zinc and cadmium transporter
LQRQRFHQIAFPDAAVFTDGEPDGRADGLSPQHSDGEEATMIPVLVAFGSFLTTLAGGFAALRFHDQQHLILGLAAGLMLGVVGFDLVPEDLAQQPGQLFGVPLAMLAAVLGFLTLHVVERSVAIHRGHEGEYAGHRHAPGLGIFAASALVGHSLLDGVAIGAGFQAGGAVGAVVAIAVLSHDFADGFNTYTITSLYGNDRRRALILLVADALAPVTGAAITLLVTIPPSILGLYLGFLAGVLLYLATSDILPEAHAHHPTRLTLACTIVGVGFMWLVIGLAS